VAFMVVVGFRCLVFRLFRLYWCKECGVGGLANVLEKVLEWEGGRKGICVWYHVGDK